MTTKAILELITVLNITNLVVGTKRTPCSRQYACFLIQLGFCRFIVVDLIQISMIRQYICLLQIQLRAMHTIVFIAASLGNLAFIRINFHAYLYKTELKLQLLTKLLSKSTDRVTGDSKPMSLRFNGLCSSFFRRLGKKMAKGKFIKKNAPEFCEVTIVHDGKKVVDNQQVQELVHLSLASSPSKPEIARQSERNFFECVCFSGKFN